MSNEKTVDASIKLQIPDNYIQGVIHAAIIESLNKSDEIIQSVVQIALAQKKDTWANETIFMSEVKEMIREQAKEAMKDWLKEKEPIIRKQIRDALIKKEGLIKQITDAVIGGVSKNLYVQVNIKGGDN